jgi:hypothetical protein
MKQISPKILVRLLVFVLIVGSISCRISGYYGMFQPHTYNWRTGMPSLQDQVIAFQQANKRWPRDYDDLASFMKQSVTNFVPESYDRIDFTTKPDGNLEIDVYVFNSGATNRITLKTPSEK